MLTNNPKHLTRSTTYTTPQSVWDDVNISVGTTLDIDSFISFFNVAIDTLNSKCLYNFPKINGTSTVMNTNYPLADFLWRAYVVNKILSQYYGSQMLIQLANIREQESDVLLNQIKSSSQIPIEFLAEDNVLNAATPWIKKKGHDNVRYVQMPLDGITTVRYAIGSPPLPWMQDKQDGDAKFLKKEFKKWR